MRIRHVIPTVGSSAPAELLDAQDLTLRSIERALRCVDSEVDVEVRAVRFPDEPVDVEWLTDVPILERSILDLGEFRVKRRLPLLPDVLAGFGDSSEYDVAVLTNVDIAIQPLFYDLVASIVDEGHDAFSITRRTVQPRFGGSSLARFATTGGTIHPGHDCFVMSSALVDQVEPGDVALGVRWVGRTLLWQLQLFAERYRHFGELHATFHIGDDRVWTDPRLVDYEQHNQARALELVERMIDQCGRQRVERLLSVRPFLAAIASGEEPRNPEPRSTSPTLEDRPRTSGARRLIFSANPGRSGSEFLSTLLGSAANVDAGHERSPRMAGPWMRRIAYEPAAASYADRRVKIDAIRSEVDRLRTGWVYADTSNMFVKTFADVVFDEFQHETISVVVLRRDPIATAKSFFELDYFGARPGAWFDWMVPPTAPCAAFRLDPADITDQFDLIFGYLVDCEVRTQALRDRTPAVTWIDASLEEITTVGGAAELLRSLDLSPPDSIGDIVANRINGKGLRKSKIDQRASFDHVRARLESFVGRFGDRPEVGLFLRHAGLESLA